jgi:rhamnogalacturonan endolyase
MTILDMITFGPKQFLGRRRLESPRHPNIPSFVEVQSPPVFARLATVNPSGSNRRAAKPAVFLLVALMSHVVRAANDVTISETESTFTLDNGIVAAQVARRSGDLISVQYKKLEMLETGPGRSYGYWSHDASRGDRTTRITIDPRTNRGERGEVSIKGVSNGRPMGSGPGGSVVADIEIRYALARGDSGIYTYSIFSHPTNYAGTSLGEARFCAKLNDTLFDWMTVDANRNMKLISAHDWNHGTVMNMKEARRMNTGLYKGQVEHKYDYSANQFETLAWGWSSTEKDVGFWFINPTVEYLSGGPTKVELSAHRDATFNTNALTAPAPPCLLNYWRSSHYGGSICAVAQGEAWTKVIGPFLIYCNSGRTPNAMWKDALARSAKESKAWPFDWVEGVDYPHRDERGTVTGQLVLNDPQAPKLKLANLLVGLSAPDYVPPRISRGGPGGFGLAGGGEDDATATNLNSLALGPGDGSTTNTNAPGRGRRGGRGGRGGGFGGFGGPRIVEWQNDAKNYEFWVRGDSRGNFSIPNVRPGRYTLHAFADGVLGEFTLTNVAVKAGETLALRKLDWQPVRFGKQLWDIGIPNRKGSEFFKGDDYYHWGWYLEYPKLFPNDVNYVIGKSDFRKDWFFEQVPHNENPANTTGTGQGRSTPWTIAFDLPAALRGKATLRLAIVGVSTRGLTVDLNDQSIGSVTGLVYNATINRDGIGGSYTQRDLVFDASLMKAGRNVMKLTIPAGGLMSGILYDYLRLELDETAKPTAGTETSGANPSGQLSEAFRRNNGN